MKVLRVIASMNPINGGPCQGIRNSLPELKKRGIHTDVVCLDEPESVNLWEDSFKITALGPAMTPWQYAPALKQWLIKHAVEYDAIIVHGLWQYHGMATLYALNFLKSKKVENLPKFYVMPHGMLDPYFQKAPERRLKAYRNIVFWHLFDKKLINKADAVLFTCEEELLLAKKTFSGYRPKNTINVGYGIPAPLPSNLNDSEEWDSNYPDLDAYLLFLSRVHHKKGTDILLKVYERLCQAHPDIPKLVIAGPGMDTDFGLNLLKYSENSPHLKDRIVFTHMLRGGMKWTAFKKASLFVLPSHQENFGIAVVEALATKLPVLISNKVNIWREIEADQAGLICEDEEESLHTALTQWLEMSSEKRKEMCESAYNCFHQRFTIEKACDQLITQLKWNTNA